jgi:acyl-CoA synthetase (AMP-forming)/AMP-acid ligase II
VCLFNRVDAPNRRGTLGLPFPGVQVVVRDELGGAEVPDGTDGEICVAGPNVFGGYVNASAHAHDSRDPWGAGLPRDGAWLRTGDRGVRNDDGTVTFRGLIKPMFTRNGFNIYPRELERVIGGLPGVRRVRVTAVPDAMRENGIVVNVTGNVTPADVQAWCTTHLAVYKQPTHVTVDGAA